MDSETSAHFNNENFIRRASEQEFTKYMVKEFGEEVFEVAFKAMNENRQLIYEDDGND
jgi:hypothetical protein